MSKRIQQSSRERGEALLREWGVGDDVEALRSVWGRDADADSAAVERLARRESAASVAALRDFEAGAGKPLRKEIRRALFRLEQRGLEVPKTETAPVVATLGGTDLEGYLSASDGNGDQLLWLVKPRRGELLQLFAVVNEPAGMRETELHPITRKVMRAAREDLLAKHGIRIVEVDWRYCDERMHEAYRRAGARGATVHGDYLGLRNQILPEPPAAVAHPILRALDAEAVRADGALLAESVSLCEADELRTWFFPLEDLKGLLDEIEGVQNSPVLLNEHVQRERIEQIVEASVEQTFGGERRDSWIRRLLDLAWVFHATQRATPARQALAVALALQASARGGVGIPFCEALLRLSLGAHMRAVVEKEQERVRDSLILTPQEAARAAQQRRGPR